MVSWTGDPPSVTRKIARHERSAEATRDAHGAAALDPGELPDDRADGRIRPCTRLSRTATGGIDARLCGTHCGIAFKREFLEFRECDTSGDRRRLLSRDVRRDQ